ncbi:MAG: outer membrane beta-barrel protein [Paludibacter sp.]|nr:outer membrane beta-barrel protein [Paludibacter sp.]
MKFIKLLFFLSALSVGMLSAQKYSIEAGFISPKQSGKYFSTNYFNGVKLGVNAEFELKNNFSLLTGVLYDVVYLNKVQKYALGDEDADDQDSIVYKTYNHSIDIPIRLAYSFRFWKDFRVFGFAGPNINIGIAQPRKTFVSLSGNNLDIVKDPLTGETYESGTMTETEDLYKSALIRRINLQIGAGGGIQWKNYQLRGGYDFGINSINIIDTSKLMHQSGWYVSLVYQF